MRRLDHSMIFLLIAGTYTPVGLLVLHGTLATVVLAVVWAERWPGSCSNWPGRARPDGSAGRWIWPWAGWRWWPRRGCSPASAWPGGC
jgi:hypothetical protein